MLRKSSSGGKYIALDFDDTTFHRAGSYPDVGAPIRAVIEKAIRLQKEGYKLIMWTCRDGDDLQDAVRAASKCGLTYDAINDNPWFSTGSRKIYATIYVDDRAPGSIEYFLNEFEQ